MELRHFIKYTPPPAHPSDCESCPSDLNDEILEWKERMKYIHEDMDWLLRLGTEEFWKQITQDETFSHSYDSFWQCCPRPYDLQDVPSQCLRIQDEIRKLSLLLFLRICDSTSLDGKANISHASLLYDNFLLDVPKVIDICSIYNNVSVDTKHLISNALEAAFKKQQGYWNDLDVAIDTIFHTFESIAERFTLLDDDDDHLPKQISTQGKTGYSSDDVIDVIVYLYDTANALWSLVSMCPFTCPILLDKGSLKRISTIVDKFLPRLKELYGKRLSEDQRKYFHRTKRQLLQFSHKILSECFFSRASAFSTDKKLLEDLLSTLSHLLSDTRFIVNYEKYFKLSDELSKIEMKSDGDHVENIVYIKQIIQSMVPQTLPESKEEVQEVEAGAVAAVPEDKIEELITQLKSMFPNEKNAFLRAAIIHFDGNPEKVVNNIIENNFPPYLEEIRHEESAPMKPQLKEKETDGALPGQYYLKSDVLKKSEIDEIFTNTATSKDFLKHLKSSDGGSAAYDSAYDDFAYDEYNDEYDDTYDSHNVGVMDADSGDELRDVTTRRTFVKPKVLRALEKPSASDEEQEGSSSEEEDNQDQNEQGLFESGWNASNRGYGRGNASWRGRGYDRRQRYNEGARNDTERNRRGAPRGENERGRPSNRGHRGGPSRPPRGGQSHPARGRGGKKNNHKSLALKKSARGMAGI
ncbi:activating signal cointegrator 1 complex subunit 2-like isoform X2 [Rhopilema esculentum]|eukprot:gene12959-3722_t